MRAAVGCFLVAGFLSAGWISYQAGRGGAAAQGFQTEAVAAGWTLHKEEAFSVQLPRGWNARSDAASAQALIQGPEREQLIIRPFFVPGSLNVRTAALVLERMSVKLLPEARWQQARPGGGNAVGRHGRAGDRAAAAVLSWMPAPSGSTGYLYIMSAPDNSYQRAEETFWKIVQSFRSSGGDAKQAGAKQPALLSYARWQDPRENAFSLEVPAGWKVSGGLFRMASVDTRPAVEAVSPDGQIRMTGGDAELPPFSVPNQMSAMAGFTEGRWYSPGYGLNMLVKRYLTGVQFAKEYVTSKAARGCADVQFQSAQDRPEAAQAINALLRQISAGVSSNLTAGEVAFTCSRQGRPMSGYYFAGTLLTGVPGGPAQWNVLMLYGYLAPPDKIETAQAALAHAVQTFRYNPQWEAMQNRTAMDTSNIVTQTNNAISNTISTGYWQRQQRPASGKGEHYDWSEGWSRAMLGIDRVEDKETGQQHTVENGWNYHWKDQQGNVIGTNTYTPPPNSRPLFRVEP